MSIHLPIAELKPALVGLGKNISKRSTLPILGMLKVERTKDGWITLTSTDLVSFITVRLEQPAEGETVQMLVSHHDLSRITKTCAPGDVITIEAIGKDKVNITYPIGTQTAATSVETLDVGLFPAVPKVKNEAVAIPDGVRATIHAALDCCSEDTTRQILNGAFLDVGDVKGSHVVATDGRHMFSANSFTVPLPESVIIPDSAFLRWKEFSRDGEWQMRVGKAEKDVPGLIQISSRRWRFIQKAMEGTYPNWRQVCFGSAEVKTTVELAEENLGDLVQLINRLPEIPGDYNHTLGLRIEGKRLFFKGRNAATDPWTEVEVQGVKIVGPSINIYLNREYVLKALKLGLNHLDLRDALSSMQFSKAGQQLIIMPVKVDAPTPPSNAPERPPVPLNKVSGNDAGDSSTTKERITTVNSTNGNGATKHEPQVEKPALELAVEQIETAKVSLRSARETLNAVLDTLKQAQREQKSTSREVQSVRTTLERLQTVRI